MSEKCLRCFRPLKTCYCKDIESFDPGIKFLFLMHPWEAYKQRTGTGRLASLTLKNSEIIIGRDFDNNKRVNFYLNNPDYKCMLLYPGENAVSAEQIDLQKEEELKKTAVLIIDATWVQARKMLHRSSNLQTLPQISFSRDYISRFSIKTQPASYCLSTIESAYYLIKELQQAGNCNQNIQAEGLMRVFLKMNEFQINCQKARESGISL